jgi:hypothetical protein
MKWPAVEKPTQAPRPPKQVLGLSCPRKQLSFDDKRKKASKGKHDYMGKGKKPMELVLGCRFMSCDGFLFW